MAEELQAEISHLLKCDCPHKHKNSKEEVRALKELRQVKSRVILMVDKGVDVLMLDTRTTSTKPRTYLLRGTLTDLSQQTLLASIKANLSTCSKLLRNKED